MAATLCSQSDGGRDRRLSLVHSWRAEPALSARPGRERLCHGIFSVVRHPPVQEDGKELCRPDLVNVLPCPTQSLPSKTCPKAICWGTDQAAKAARTTQRCATSSDEGPATSRARQSTSSAGGS